MAMNLALQAMDERPEGKLEAIRSSSVAADDDQAAAIPPQLATAVTAISPAAGLKDGLKRCASHEQDAGLARRRTKDVLTQRPLHDGATGHRLVS